MTLNDSLAFKRQTSGRNGMAQGSNPGAEHQVYNNMFEQQMEKREVDKRIYDFFRKKPDVIQPLSNQKRDPNSQNPGIDLALELYSGNALNIKEKPRKRRIMY